MRFKKIVTPVTIFSFWWGGWLLLTNLGINDIFVPDLRLQLLVLISISSYSLSFLFIPIKLRKFKNPDSFNKMLFKQKPLDRFYLFIFILVVPYFIKCLVIFKTYVGDVIYRRAVFDGGENGSSILFEDPFTTFIYFKVIFSAITVGLIISLIYYYAYNEKKYLYWSMLLLIMKSIMLLSRNDIYGMAIFFVLTEIFFGKSKISANVTSYFIKKRRLYLLLILSISIISISIVSYFRLTEAELYKSDFNFFTFYLQQLIDYHTQGLLLMNSQINDPNSFINDNMTYGLASLGGLEEIIALVIRKFGIDYDTLSVYLNQYKDQTYGEIAPGVYYSIYYTMFFEFYLDGREFFVFLVSGLLGYTTAYFYLDWLKNQSLDSLFYLLILVNTLIMSIFQTQFSSPFWISLSLFFGLKKICGCKPFPFPKVMEEG